MRNFEKISIKEFTKVFDESLYNDVIIPKRSTKNSAGYDFYLIKDISIKVGESLLIPTGIKAVMNNDEFLGIYIRSSLGFKYNVRMCNQVGIVDSDYYNNENNEGHIMVKLVNEGDKDLNLKKGDRVVQGIFQKYYTVDNDISNNTRLGGIGSTTKEENNE